MDWGAVILITLLVTPICYAIAFIWRREYVKKQRMENRSEEEQRRDRPGWRVACRFCDEFISPNAVVCPFCRRDIGQAENSAAQPASAHEAADKTQSSPTTKQTAPSWLVAQGSRTGDYNQADDVRNK